MIIKKNDNNESNYHVGFVDTPYKKQSWELSSNDIIED